MKTPTVKIFMHSIALAVLLAACSGQKSATTQAKAPVTGQLSQQNVDATLWFATSAENYYLFEQTYYYATERLKLKVKEHNGPLSPSVIIDLDETVLDNSPYMMELLRKGETFSEESWAAWVAKEDARALPGASAFLRYCEENGIQVFYISNRSAEQLDATLKNMTKLMLPFADPEHVMLKQGESDKTPRRRMVSEKSTPVLMLGDNLLDFNNMFVDRSNGFGKDVVKQNAKEMLPTYILFPNPMYGQWQKAFEPEDGLGNEAQRAARKIQMAKPTDY
jgi:5'-nucleotidase (lipoprotein e(P4) family)